MKSTLQRVLYLFSEFKIHIFYEFSDEIIQNDFLLGQATEDQLKGYFKVAQEERDFIQFYKEAMKTFYIAKKCQCEVLLQTRELLN